jgi:hypothetical protein
MKDLAEQADTDQDGVGNKQGTVDDNDGLPGRNDSAQEGPDQSPLLQSDADDISSLSAPVLNG